MPTPSDKDELDIRIDELIRERKKLIAYHKIEDEQKVLCVQCGIIHTLNDMVEFIGLLMCFNCYDILEP